MEIPDYNVLINRKSLLILQCYRGEEHMKVLKKTRK